MDSSVFQSVAQSVPSGISLGTIVAVVALFTQTGALFFWGGQVHRALKDHDSKLEDHGERIQDLEKGHK